MDGQGMLFSDRVELGAGGERSAPYQHASTSSQAGARFIDQQGKRGTVAGHIVQALWEAGPAGMTVEELAAEVTRRRGKQTKETTITGRVAGDRPELFNSVRKREQGRASASGIPVDVYVHRAHYIGGVW